MALPAMRDHWHFLCAPKGATNKLLGSAKSKMSSASGELESGIATFNYACVLSAAEARQFDLQMAKFQEGGGKGKQPVLSHSNSNGWLKSAAQKLSAAAKSKKADPKANYYLAYALGLQGDDWAVNRFDDAIKADSDLSPEATIGMAEFLFDKKGAAAANDYYKKALKSKKTPVQAYARYKLAWVAYVNGAQTKNRAAQKAAITSMAKLSKDMSQGKGAALAFSKTVNEDILSLVVDYGDQVEAQKILQAVGAKDVYAIFLERMAYTKVQANDSAGAYKLFQAAIKEKPNAYATLQLSVNVAGLAAQMANVPLVVANMKIIVNNYINEKSQWRQKQKAADLKKSDKQIEDLLHQYATAIDQQGRAENKPPYLNAALDLYALFLKTFPKSDKTYDVKFFNGQLLYLQKKNKESADALTAMINENPKGKYTKDALDLIVTSAQVALDSDKTKYTLPAPGSMKKEFKIPPVKVTYANALDLYVKYVPAAKNPNAAAMWHATGSVYYDFGHYKDSLPRYFALIKAFPADVLSKNAAARIFEYYKLQKGEKGYESIKEKLAVVPQLKSAPELAPYFAAQGIPLAEEKPAKAEKKGKKKKKKAAVEEDDEDEQEDGEATTVSDTEESEDE